jgi:pimeloyl-ACP methyl ester carboxylesterase
MTTPKAERRETELRVFRATAALLWIFASACLGQTRAADEVFPPSDVMWGKKITKDDCSLLREAVWVEHRYGSECIRYFPSPGIDQAGQANFFFHGDVADVAFYKDNKAGILLESAKRLEATYGFPFIYVGRPGAYGSSGYHAERRRPKEFYSLNAAVDAIKVKHGIGKVILSGQSGGATSVGALLTLGRTDVVCAVGTSGGYAVIERAEFARRRIGARSLPGVDSTGFRDAYDVINYVSGIQADPKRRIFIIGDLLDQTTPFSLQKKFADLVRAAGHEVQLVEAAAKGAQHHSLRPVGILAAGLCGQGVPTEELILKIRSHASAE